LIARKNLRTFKTNLIRSNKIDALLNLLLFSIAYVLTKNILLQLKLVFKSKSKCKKLVTKNLKKRESKLSVIEQKLLIKNSYILLQQMRFVNCKIAQSIL